MAVDSCQGENKATYYCRLLFRDQNLRIRALVDPGKHICDNVKNLTKLCKYDLSLYPSDHTGLCSVGPPLWYWAGFDRRGFEQWGHSTQSSGGTTKALPRHTMDPTGSRECLLVGGLGILWSRYTLYIQPTEPVCRSYDMKGVLLSRHIITHQNQLPGSHTTIVGKCPRNIF